jgi:hypothetical protein
LTLGVDDAGVAEDRRRGSSMWIYLHLSMERPILRREKACDCCSAVRACLLITEMNGRVDGRPAA